MGGADSVSEASRGHELAIALALQAGSSGDRHAVLRPTWWEHGRKKGRDKC